MSREAYPELISILSDFSTKSFTELQAAAYVALIKMGEESGSAIAGEAGINRSKIYDILGQLEEMGAVAKVSREGKTRYVAIPPDQFLPRLITKFTDDITKAQEGLNDIMNLQEEIQEAAITLTTLDINQLDANEFEYLISTSEVARVKFVDKLNKDKRPGTSVRILNLNSKREGRGMILLLGNHACYLFGTPTGNKFEALQITSQEIVQFIRGIIEADWLSDIPEYVKDEIDHGERLALAIDKAVFVRYELFTSNQEFEYSRPITMVISNEHISYFYEEIEELKIPLQFINSVQLLEDGLTIKAKFRSTAKEIGDLQMRVVGHPFLIKNIIQHIINTNN